MNWLSSLVSPASTGPANVLPKTEPIRIVIAVDGSPASHNAFDWAMKRFAHVNDEIHLISVVTPTASFNPGPATVMWVDPTEGQLKQADKVLEDYVKQARTAGLPVVKYQRLVTQHGASEDVGRALQNYARANKIDEVVLGSRGLSAVASAVYKFVGLGSVSSWCVHHLDCTVVVHKTKHH